jgi:hypothetical protein
MGRDRLRGLPPREAFEAAARVRTKARRLVATVTDIACGPDLGTVLAELRVVEEAQKFVPPARGRRFEADKLRRAAEALAAAAVPLTSGDRGIGPRVIAKALRVPEATARGIARRLAEMAKGHRRGA